MARLFLVDDEPELLEILALNLEMAGHKVEQASGGYEALKMLETVQVDLIVSDMQMPFGNGIELIKGIKGRGLQVPIVFLTGYSEFLDEARELGADEIVQKPIALDALLEIIRRLVPAQKA